MKVLRTFALAAAAAALLATAACGGDDNSLENSDSSGDSDAGSGDKGSVTISGQDFTEMQIMAAMYGQVLEKAGYDVTTKLVQTRDIYLKGLTDGSIDVVPEYLAGITDAINIQRNGENAETVSTNDPEETLAALEPLAKEAGITMLQYSEATDQNAFFVTQDFADENSVTTLSQMADVMPTIKLGAPADCEGRPDCEAGLTKVYGFDITEIVPLDFGSAQVKDAVTKGEVDMGETGTTDGSLADLGLVILEDDKGIQPAQNLIPAVNSGFLADHPDIEDTLNELSATLTTQDLADMNYKVDAERQQPEDVASEYLADKGLV
jgi:osmoprotectant transport system substrate-binding protein